MHECIHAYTHTRVHAYMQHTHTIHPNLTYTILTIQHHKGMHQGTGYRVMRTLLYDLHHAYMHTHTILYVLHLTYSQVTRAAYLLYFTYLLTYLLTYSYLLIYVLAGRAGGRRRATRQTHRSRLPPRLPPRPLLCWTQHLARRVRMHMHICGCPAGNG